jgi:hypothetical protein
MKYELMFLTKATMKIKKNIAGIDHTSHIAVAGRGKNKIYGYLNLQSKHFDSYGKKPVTCSWEIYISTLGQFTVKHKVVFVLNPLEPSGYYMYHQP